jgi:hypothetical protein
MMPARRPWSISASRTHRRNVSVVQPNFAAIELIAAHCDECSSGWLRTIRTARSRTSGEYRKGHRVLDQHLFHDYKHPPVAKHVESGSDRAVAPN